MTDETDPGVHAARIRERWTAAFRVRDTAALAALYAPDALFFGSTPELHRGRDGVRAYFSTLAPDIRLEDFGVMDAVAIRPDLLVAAGYWSFRFGGELRPYRLTWTLSRQGGAWLIAAHHASPRG